MKKNTYSEIAFFGKITAGITHEMKNVLAIIKESSGLMEDLIQLCQKDSEFPYIDRMSGALAAINVQIQRGVDLTDHLNRFAHEPDEVIKAVDLTDQVEQLLALAQRFVRLRKVVLKLDPPNIPIKIETRSIQFQMLLFAGIECCLQVLKKGGEICLRLRQEKGKNRIHIICRDDDPNEMAFAESFDRYEQWSAVQKLAKILGGTAVQDTSARAISIILPQKVPK
jgi:C4-dicarboxylate-specific signal transduction histidine kinase